MCSFLTCSVCLLMMGSECVWALGEGSNFQLVRGPQNWVFKQKEQFDPTLLKVVYYDFESCPFICTHGSEIATPQDSCLKGAVYSSLFLLVVVKPVFFSPAVPGAVYNRWTGLLDWTTGLLDSPKIPWNALFSEKLNVLTQLIRSLKFLPLPSCLSHNPIVCHVMNYSWHGIWCNALQVHAKIHLYVPRISDRF